MSDPRMRSHQGDRHGQASVESLYDLVSDITRTGEWSPVCNNELPDGPGRDAPRWWWLNAVASSPGS